jgi:hypothetical protein
MMYDMLYSLPVLEAPRSGRQSKHAVVKKLKLYIRWLTDEHKGHAGGAYSCWLTDEYMGPHIRSGPRSHTPVYLPVTCHRQT